MKTIKNYWPRKQDSVGDQADCNYQDVDQDAPEALLNGARVFQPKDENVSGQDGSVKQKKNLPFESVLEDRLNETEYCWLWSKEVSRNLEQMNQRNIDDPCPTSGSEE